MGNCCTRVKDANEENNEPKVQLVDKFEVNISIFQAKLYFTFLKTANIDKILLQERMSEMTPNVEQAKLPQKAHSRRQSIGNSIDARSKNSFQKNSIECLALIYQIIISLEQLLNKQFQEFQNRIYQEKVIEIDTYMKLFENFQGFDEMPKDYLEQIQNFQNSMEFLLNFQLFCESQTSQKINNLNFKFSQFLMKYYEFQEKQFKTSLKSSQYKKKQETKDDSQINTNNLVNSPANPRVASSIDLDTNKSLDLSLINDSMDIKNQSIDIKNSVDLSENSIEDSESTLDKMMLLNQIYKCETFEQCKKLQKKIAKISKEKSFKIDNWEEFDIIGFLSEGKRLSNKLKEEINELKKKENIDETILQVLEAKQKNNHLIIQNVVQIIDPQQQDLAQDIKKNIFKQSEPLGQQLLLSYYKRITNQKDSKQISRFTSPSERQATAQIMLDDEIKTQGNDDDLILGVLNSPNKSNIDNILKKLNSSEMQKLNN